MKLVPASTAGMRANSQPQRRSAFTICERSMPSLPSVSDSAETPLTRYRARLAAARGPLQRRRLVTHVGQQLVHRKLGKLPAVEDKNIGLGQAHDDDPHRWVVLRER